MHKVGKTLTQTLHTRWDSLTYEHNEPRNEVSVSVKRIKNGPRGQ